MQRNGARSLVPLAGPVKSVSPVVWQLGGLVRSDRSRSSRVDGMLGVGHGVCDSEILMQGGAGDGIVQRDEKNENEAK